MKLQAVVIALAVALAAPIAVDGKLHAVYLRNSGPHASPEFKFRVVASPSPSDAAANASWTLVDGERDPNGADLSALHDGKLPTSEDGPGYNFFFAAGTNGGRVLVDLGALVVVEQVNSYSWHASTRGPQVYRLYASDGTTEGFNPRPAAEADLEALGWKPIATVDTRPSDRFDEGGGQYAVSIFDSDGPVGRFRYLLFDISRTEDSDPFGNTFFSEIDVVGSAAGPEAAGPAGVATFEAGDGKYRFTIDTSDTADLTEWATKELAPVVQEWYPKIVEMLPSEDYEAPTEFSITFSSRMRGVAAAGGTRIRGGAAWFRRNLDGEAKGAIVHELVHVVQQYGRGRPGWLIEGIPDYIRWFLYEPETRGAEITERNIDQARYDGNYRISGNFLNWVVSQHGSSIIEKVNAALREGTYRENLWQELTGSTLDDLDAQWKVSLERAIAAGNAAEDSDE